MYACGCMCVCVCVCVREREMGTIKPPAVQRMLRRAVGSVGRVSRDFECMWGGGGGSGGVQRERDCECVGVCGQRVW